MIAYNSFSSIIWTHFLIGVMIGAGLIVFAKLTGGERHFQFGGDLVSFGLPHRWLAWVMACLAFEFLSSCKSSMMYQEMALSLIETPAMVFGAFVVDRIARWKEFDAQFVIERPAFRRRERPQEQPPDDGPAKRRFDDLTKDK